jgi:hypothetical protein
LIKADNLSQSSAKDALDLLEAAQIATEKGPVNNWEEDLINEVIHIFKTHPVSYTFYIYRNK